MSYRHYTNEYKQTIVEEFLGSGELFYPFCERKTLNPRTIRRWLEIDGRHTFSSRPRILQDSVFSGAQKLKAVELRLSGIMLREVATRIGTTPMTIAAWTKTYQEKGEYALMSREDIKNGNISNIDSLKKQIEEQAEIIHKQQMKIHAYEMAQELLKNFPALSWSESLTDLTNAVKVELIERLRAKFRYKLKDLLELFALHESSYHTGKNAIKRTLQWQNRWKVIDEEVCHFIESDDNLCRKQGRREILQLIDTDVIKVSENRLRTIMRDNNLQAWQSKSMKRHNSFRNDGNPPVKNWLFGKDKDNNYVHFFNPENPWEILGTDVTEIHVNGFKVFLSMIIDFYDGAPVTWKIGNSPNTELIVGSVEDLVNEAPVDARFILHMDQGSINRSDKMKATCRDNHILQSMSRKGKSGDNAPTEGFFGQMKQQWFNKTDFTGMSYDEVVDAWDKWLNWYCNVRPKSIYGGLPPRKGRSMLQYKEVA
jgi:transposase InsO family protein/transposase-like protein